jgi:hypothetical protein
LASSTAAIAYDKILTRHFLTAQPPTNIFTLTLPVFNDSTSWSANMVYTRLLNQMETLPDGR